MSKTAIKKTPLELVKEIHTRVLTASDLRLDEARSFQKEMSQEDIDLASKMTKLGFGKVKEIKEKKEEIEKKQLAIARANNIEHFSRHYQQKYIPIEDMEQICKDYGLFMGADQHFIGSMPIHVQRDIVNFKLREEDKIFYKGVWQKTNSKYNAKTDKTTESGVFNWVEIPREQYNTETSNGTTLIHDDGKRNYISNDDYFIIVAPRDQFEAEGVFEDGVNLKTVVEFTKDDPAALKPVKNGFLVVRLWGEEAAIARMQNEKLN